MRRRTRFNAVRRADLTFASDVAVTKDMALRSIGVNKNLREDKAFR